MAGDARWPGCSKGRPFNSSLCAPTNLAFHGAGETLWMDGRLHTGVGARVLLGSAYFDIHSEGDSVVAFGARSAGFSWESIQRIGGLFDGDAQWLNVLSPTGFGWGLDVGAVLSRSDGLWFSASVVDIGRMTWNGQEYEVNNIDVSLTDFGSSAGAIDPDSWLTGAIDLFDADSWFQTSKEGNAKCPTFRACLGRRVQACGTGGLGKQTVRNKEALSNGGWTVALGGVRSQELDLKREFKRARATS